MRARTRTAAEGPTRRVEDLEDGVTPPKTAQPPVLCCAPLAAGAISDEEAEATAELFKALADPHRVRIVNRLAAADEAVCVCDITDELGLSQPTTSFHLKKLVASGLLRRERHGTWAYYSIAEDALARLGDVVAGGKGAR
ncbi:MAG: metalloregulator ArsR/SmtB family transcription factor [Chloroflexi bacterium]|nr:metalloregulator ArsR/SmtB family transcription factor [Chloroflexota bacterium]